MSRILFEGKKYRIDLIGKIWRRQSVLFCVYKEKPIMLKKYPYVDRAQLGKKILLFKLNRSGHGLGRD